ncbi:hypothetical protein [uncultured Ruegeria sp.]|uniref:hypothetical protein n=1 Tax=uncultured Ruegeria sp. TaxID=259304 RepID=UPI0026152843|nr:hypothetical protein [uncultured Ruegeria sp.]
MTGFKTIGFAVATALVPVLSMTEAINLVPPEYLDEYMLGVAIVTALLRAKTSTPIFKS